MAYAKKCDRCGKLYEQYNDREDKHNINGVLTLNIDSVRKYWSNDVLDFCPECCNEFVSWLKKGKEKKK